LVVAQSSSEISEELMNNPVLEITQGMTLPITRVTIRGVV
jgi:hypothetical protein